MAIRNKMYFFIKFFLILIFLNPCLFLVTRAEIELSKSLPKTKDTGISLEIKPNEGDKNDDGKDNLEEEKKVDPTKIYKLIAIYLINKQPRALIKNVTLPDEAAKEYQVGDYLDDLQSLSISKILLNPTFRIEIIDQDGLTYLVKPHETDNKGTSTANTTYGTKSMQNYFSGGSKYKPRKTSPTTQEAESTPSPTVSDKKGEEKPSLESTIKKEENIEPTLQAPPSASLQAIGSGSSYASSTKSDSKASPQATDPSSRPTDPFNK